MGMLKRLNWMVFEEISTSNNVFDHSQRAYDVDEADKFFDHQGVAIPKKHDTVWTTVPILEQMWGKPWNNLALSMVSGFRPSRIRVTTGVVTCDAMTDRITVWLEKDGRTIRSIDQEVACWAIGVKSGQDLSCKAKGTPLPAPSDEPMVYVNKDAIDKIKFT